MKEPPAKFSVNRLSTIYALLTNSATITAQTTYSAATSTLSEHGDETSSAHALDVQLRTDNEWHAALHRWDRIAGVYTLAAQEAVATQVNEAAEVKKKVTRVNEAIVELLPRLGVK